MAEGGWSTDGRRGVSTDGRRGRVLMAEVVVTMPTSSMLWHNGAGNGKDDSW